MKTLKMFLASSAFAASALAANPAQAVESVVSKMLPPSASAQVAEKEKLSGGWSAIEVNIKDPSGAVLATDYFFSDGNFVAPMLFSADGKDYKGEYKAQAEQKLHEQIAAKLPDYLAAHKNFVRLGDHGGEASVVFTDPDCPFCRKHLQTLEQELKEHDVIMVLMPLPMHKNALNKAALLLEDVAKLGAKASTKSKLDVFKKYFADGEFGAAKDADKKALDLAANDAFALGINYTPAIFTKIKTK